MTTDEQIAELQAIRDAVTAYTESMYTGNMDWLKSKENKQLYLRCKYPAAKK